MGFLQTFFPNINEYELKLLERYFAIIVRHISLKFYTSEKDLLEFIHRNPTNAIGIITLIIPFYGKTFNNVMTLRDLFYNKVYTNKFIETSCHEKKSIDQILENNTSCLLNTIDIVANKLYYNWNEILPITMETYKLEKMYIDTFKKIYHDKDPQNPAGLSEGDIFNVIANDLNVNYNCVEWLLFEYEGKSYDEIIKTPGNATQYQYQVVVKNAVDYMLKYFPSFNTIGLNSDNYLKILEPQNKIIWIAYIDEVYRVFNKSWYSTRNHNIGNGVTRFSLYTTFKSFSKNKRHLLWGTLEPGEIDAYRNSLRSLLESKEYLRENLTDIVFETLIKKGCLSKLNLKNLGTDAKETFFFLDNRRTRMPINKFYTMNWISQINFFNHFINNRVIFVTGGTGVGKSTQSPVLIMYADTMIYYNTSSRIVCSVPRKNAVENNCKYIRKGVKLPDDNFSVQFQHKDDKLIPKFKFEGKELRYEKYNQTLTIVTDEILKNSLLKNMYCVHKEKFTYNHILIDESHEHKINMDLILTILKHGMLRYNVHTKLFIISATMEEDDESYRYFFNQTRDDSIFFKMWSGDFHFLDRRIHISPYNVQNNFTIKEFYLSEKITKYEQSEKYAIEKVVEICNTTLSGTILMFSIGQQEIARIITQLNALTPANTIAFPLYSILHPSFKISISSTILDDWLYDKSYVLELLKKHSSDWFSPNLPYPKKKYSRYIIVGTNIVEASLTISTLKYVVETGFEKVSIFNKQKAEEEIKVLEISESSRIQRRGRVGRVSNGYVFYMYPKDSRKNNPIQKEFKNSDISSYLFNIVGFKRISNLKDIISYLNPKKSVPDWAKLNTDEELFFDGFSPETISRSNFFLIKPEINVKLFYEFHKSHRYWQYFFKESYLNHIQNLRNIMITYTYISLYETFVLVLFYQKNGINEFLKILEHIFRDFVLPDSLVTTYKPVHFSPGTSMIPSKTVNAEINNFITYVDKHFVYIYSDDMWEYIIRDLYYEKS